MNTSKTNNAPSVVYSYTGQGLPTWDAVEKGHSARERLFGAFQLAERGFHVEIADAQWTDGLAWLRKRLPSILEFPSLKLLSAMRRNDAVGIQGRIAPLLQLAAMFLGCRVVFIDVMFDPPRRWLSAAVTAWCLRRASAIVSYSQSQNESWARQFGLDKSRMYAARYPMDSDFYKAKQSTKSARTQVVSVGRDVGRDFQTLVDAAAKGRFAVALVTLDYLVPKNRPSEVNLEIFHYLDYPALFALYGGSVAAVVPLKRDVDYPSGIRAALEAMLLEAPLIATRTPVLEEYFVDEEHLIFVSPGNADEIAEAVARLERDPQLRSRLSERARQTVTEQFGVEQFADLMEAALWQRRIVPTSGP